MLYSELRNHLSAPQSPAGSRQPGMHPTTCARTRFITVVAVVLGSVGCGQNDSDGSPTLGSVSDAGGEIEGGPSTGSVGESSGAGNAGVGTGGINSGASGVSSAGFSSGGETSPGMSDGGSGATATPATDAAGDGDGISVGDAGSDASSSGETSAFVHPGLLHSAEDFERMITKVAAGAQPWKSGWDVLLANPHSSLNWTPNPAPVVYRGTGSPQNYAQLYNDIAAAYALAIRWKISGDTAYADKSVQILNAWSAVLTGIDGTSDKFLASGIYGYEIANAAEIMRTYPGWSAADFDRFKNMMLTVFYPMNHDFLLNHNGACITHYWANWDLCNMASTLAIGVLADDRAIYNEAIAYFKTGTGNGAIEHVVDYLYPDNLGQWQESGRDQGHSALGVGLLGAFSEMAWNQGDDMYSYSQDRFMAGAEYVASYNLGNSVPYTTYTNCDGVTQTMISASGRGDIRPIWELLYNHYVNLMGLPAPYIEAFAAKVRPEGGGGDYGTTSGGYDQLGYGTLTATLK